MLTVNVTEKSYTNNKTVIERLQFSVAPGERVCLVGPSGAGKSTLLNMIVGLDTDYSGFIGWQANGAEPRPVLEVTTATKMFQDARLMPWLSVWDNLMLVAKSCEQQSAWAEELLAVVNLSDMRDAYPAQLSGGMKKRLALARALLPKPQLILMDEPFSSLDAPTANELLQLVKQLCSSSNITLICVTHDLNEAYRLGDRILFFSKAPMRLLHEKSPSSSTPVAEQCEQLIREHPNLLVGHK